MLDRRDRVQIAVHDAAKAAQRFAQFRPAVRGRLLDADARYMPRGSDPATNPDGGWVHPKELHGLLLGMSSRTGLAWDWSGREELVPSV